MNVTAALAALVAELTEAGVPDPLSTRFTLATTFDDLLRLAGEPVPSEIAAALDAPACTVALPPPPRRVPVPRYAD